MAIGKKKRAAQERASVFALMLEKTQAQLANAVSPKDKAYQEGGWAGIASIFPIAYPSPDPDYSPGLLSLWRQGFDDGRNAATSYDRQN